LVTCRDLKLTLAVNAAITPRRPLLIKSEPGTGKTMLAEEVATSLGLPLFEWHVKSTTQRSRGSTNTMLSRAALVKDETHFDKFDRAFGEYFKGVEALPGMDVLIPEAWLRQAVKQHLSDAERARLEKLGWDKLMETFIVSKSARATSRSRCAACAVLPARALPTSSTSKARSPAPRATPAGSTCTCARNVTTPSRCCCSSTSAARWTSTSAFAKNSSRPAAASSSTSMRRLADTWPHAIWLNPESE